MITGIQDIRSHTGFSETFAPHQRNQELAQTGCSPQSCDTVQISEQGREQLIGNKLAAPGISGGRELDAEQQRDVEQLKRTDQEVKAHEKAHMAAGAGLVTGGASYRYQRGPDGKMYAVGGEVKIDTSREKDPKATIRKMQQVKRAALAPTHPSGQDRSVAARASQIEVEARIELQKQQAEEAKQKKLKDESPTGINSTPPHNLYNSSSIDPAVNIVV